MIIVAAGSSTRFGSDKMLARIGERRLIEHTVDAVLAVVEHCVLVARSDQVETLRLLDLEVTIVAGGATRTESELAGLAAVGQSALIGIHDGARPATSPEMMERLFVTAATSGGAVPGLPPARPLVERGTLGRVTEAVRVQTPQVFWGPELVAAYRAALTSGFSGHDTADIVHNFTNLEVMVVPGDPDNVKVTYPADIEVIRERLS